MEEEGTPRSSNFYFLFSFSCFPPYYLNNFRTTCFFNLVKFLKENVISKPLSLSILIRPRSVQNLSLFKMKLTLDISYLLIFFKFICCMTVCFQCEIKITMVKILLHMFSFAEVITSYILLTSSNIAVLVFGVSFSC